MQRTEQGTLKFNKAELMHILESLGADDAEGQANSQLSEGIPQLARFLFLRSAWKYVLNKGDVDWIDQVLARTHAESNDPFGGTAHSLRRLLVAGADRNDLSELVRNQQAEILFQFCYLLDDPFAAQDDWPPDVAELLEDIGWALFETDDDGMPLRSIGGLHESVLETDPTGAEMRPFGRDD